MIRIGFTGTRKGMSAHQQRLFEWLLRALAPGRLSGGEREFHHGAAYGADTQAALIAARFDGVRIVPHPAGKDPLKRNREIVAQCDLLIAAPHTDVEVLRSGTWYTVRRAREAGKPYVVLPRAPAQARQEALEQKGGERP